MRIIKRKRSVLDRFTVASIALAGLAAVFAYGLIQSGTRTTWTACTVEAKPHKTMMSGLKRWSTKRLVCNHDSVIIAIKTDHPLPLTNDDVLEPNSVLSCSYDVAQNPYRLFSDQIVIDSVECTKYSDTG